MVLYYKIFGVIIVGYCYILTNTATTRRFSTIHYSRRSMHLSLGATIHSMDYCADDIVIFSPAGDIGNFDNLRVGVICPQKKNIYPLCCKEELLQDEMFDSTKQDLVLNLYYDEDAESCKADKSSFIILAILNDVQYSQRMIEDRVSNPHGEHAEDVWTINLPTAILDNIITSSSSSSSSSLSEDGDMERSMLTIPLLLRKDCDPWITVADLSLLEMKGTPAVRINIVPSLHY